MPEILNPKPPGHEVTGVPAWAGFGSTPDSQMYMQHFVYVPFCCDVALLQASVVLCGVSCWPFVH